MPIIESYQTKPPVNADDRTEVQATRTKHGDGHYIGYHFDTASHLQRSRSVDFLVTKKDLIKDLVELCGGPRAAISALLEYDGNWDQS